MARFLLALVSGVVAVPGWAQSDAVSFVIGEDFFLAGRSVSHVDAGTDDLFMAGERVAGKADVAGSAHLAGREVEPNPFMRLGLISIKHVCHGCL